MTYKQVHTTFTLNAFKEFISLFSIYICLSKSNTNVHAALDAEYTISIRLFASIGDSLLMSCTRTEFGGKHLLCLYK